MRKRLLVPLLVVAFTATMVLAGPGPKAAASPVADSDALYELYGRVFPDPHGCVRGQPGKSPYAKGTVCATQFLQYPELVSGLGYLQSKFQEFMDVYQLEGETAGIPTTTRERRSSRLYAVRVTDERVTGPKKKFGFSLSIHGIERAGAEGGTRAIEDLVTWARHEPGRGLLDETLGAGTSAVTVERALRESEIWFFYPNPDGWVRGDVTQGGAAYQRYNGNGVDPNRDWPTIGYTYRGYTPASEPEVKAFIDFFAARKGGWVGTGDLHGMLDANAFTFTMMPAGQLDYARNKAVVSVARRIQEDADPRLSWYLGIQPGNESGSVPDVAQQWGTVWDTIDYTVTGGLGDWMGTPLGLDAYVAIDNEMWLSHLAPNNVFEPDLEQAHIDGNKGLIYAQIEGAFRESSRTFPLPGKLAYVDHGRRFTHSGSTASTDPHAGLSPQPDITADVVSPTTNGNEGDPLDPTYEFAVLGPESGGYRSGGFTVKVTYTNTQGISPADLITAVHVERACQDDHDCSSGEWEIVNSHWNQAQLYAASGHTVNVNAPLPGQYRVRFDDAPPGSHRVEIDFTRGPSWPDPGQLPYDVSSAEFFEDLAPFVADGAITRLTPDQILSGGADLAQYDTVVLVNDPLPGWYDPIGAGGVQDPIAFTMVNPVASPVTHSFDATREFDVDNTRNSKSMVIAATWPIASDYDLFVDIQMPSGRWIEVGSSTQGISQGETVRLSNMFPGHYRVRLQNWAGVAQTVDVRITFGDTAVLEPVQYPVTRTAAERDAYYARLRAFVEGGGNLVLTDGASRALPHLGVGTPADIRPQVVYAPYAAFTTDGVGDTYADPLARDVDQPGAAEGSGHRHQTQEPVPLGYAIQDADGANSTHSFSWAVAPKAWADAGGRTVGIVGGGVTLGEIERGAGRIRFVGGLLPDPEERYDHPFGLSSYALTYTGWQLFENLVQWTRPLPDLAIASSDVVFSTAPKVEGKAITITATVRNLGAAAASNVGVRFTDNGTQIGDLQTIQSIPAGGSAAASVTWNTKGTNGERTITAAADPSNAIRELSESNNTGTVTVTIKGNKVRNASFEESSNGTSPDSWSSSGNTTYAQGEDRQVAADVTGSWTSDPIDVVAGQAYGIEVETVGGTIAVEQLSAAGIVLAKLSGVTAFTAAADVTRVRIVLTGGLLGTSTFDDVLMWER
jgi:CARDB protein/zinc carboxypeptidase